MKKQLLTLVFIILCCTLFSQKRTIDLHTRMKSITLKEGVNVIDQSTNGLQLVLEISGTIKTWKMITSKGVSTILTPYAINQNIAKKKSGGKKSSGNKPTSCEICYHYPENGSEMIICYTIPCP